MVEAPKEINVNVVMGPQLRAIVRSALMHVRNQFNDDSIAGSGEIRERVRRTIDTELAKWPLETEPEDTLAQWLFRRFNSPRVQPYATDWGKLDEADKSWWEHEADAVRRAVGRGGFKDGDKKLHLDTPVSALNKANERAEVAGGEVKGFRELGLKATNSLGEAIRIAIGAPSTCWTHLERAGAFKPEEALDIACQLEHHVRTEPFAQLPSKAERQYGDLT